MKGFKGVSLRLSSVFFFVVFAALSPWAEAQSSRRDEMNLAYSAMVPVAAPFWIAHDQGLFDKEGLSANLIYINSAARTLSAIFAGEVQATLISPAPIPNAYAQGADLVIIAGAVNKMTVSIMSVPEIRNPPLLRGGKLAITRFGGLFDFSATYALKKWGLQPGKDVVIIQIGDIPAIMAALESRSVQAATLQPPFTFRLRRLGYHNLMELAEAGFEYQNTAVVTTRSFIRKEPERIRKFMRAYSRAVAFYHNDKEATVRVIGKNLRGMDPMLLEESYEYFKQFIPKVPYLNRAGVETAIELAGKLTDRKIQFSDIVDEGLVRELDQQGFYKTLYRR